MRLGSLECEIAYFSTQQNLRREKKKVSQDCQRGEQTYAFPDLVVGRICRLAAALAWQKSLTGVLEEDE
jgi:hypothetical protein